MFEASGEASLYSYVISHRPHPGFKGPYSIAVVELEEGPRMMTNIVGCDPDDVHTGMAVEVEFEHRDDVWLPLVRPVAAAPAEVAS